MTLTYPVFTDSRPGYNLREIRPGIWLSGVRGAYEVPPARGIPWAAVVNLSGHQDGAPRWTRGPYLGWHFEDGAAFPPGLLAAISALAQEGLRTGPVLVHCAAGLSRSASAGYYLLRVLHGLDHAEALRRVRCPELDPQRRFPVSGTLISARAEVECRCPSST